jgi:hypothetical protein
MRTVSGSTSSGLLVLISITGQPPSTGWATPERRRSAACQGSTEAARLGPSEPRACARLRLMSDAKADTCRPEGAAELPGDGWCGCFGKDRADRAVEVEQQMTGAADHLPQAAGLPHGWARLMVAHMLSSRACAGRRTGRRLRTDARRSGSLRGCPHGRSSACSYLFARRARASVRMAPRLAPNDVTLDPATTC